MPSLTDIRPQKDADRAALLALDVHEKAVDDANTRLFVAEENGQLEGVAMWIHPGNVDTNNTPRLEAVVLREPTRIALMYKLAAAVCQDAIDAGFTKGAFVLKSMALNTRLNADFDIDSHFYGRDPKTGETNQVIVTVDLADAISQLQRFL